MLHFNFLISLLALPTIIAIPWPTASGWQAGAVVQGRREENLKTTIKENNNKTQN